jgi:hypothetical protein
VSYRLYLDEAGDHSSSHVSEIGKRYLGLTGVILQHDAHYKLTESLNGIKRIHFPDHPTGRPLILHREDILYKRGPFRVLLDRDKCKAFDAHLLAAISAADFNVITVVIDKVSHGGKRYRTLTHPYHYSLLAILERYCGKLQLMKQVGDIMAESRGGTEDRALRQAYDYFYAYGDTYLSSSLIKKTMSSREIKIKKKEADVAGLQLADLLAHPLTRDVIVAYGRSSLLGGPFAEKILEVVRPKYHRHWGQLKGYGQKFLG